MDRVFGIILLLVLPSSLVWSTPFNEPEHYDSFTLFRSTRQAPTCSSDPFSCTGRQPGKYADPFDCKNVIVCGDDGNQYTIIVDCPEGQELNPSTGECGPPPPVSCTPCPAPPPSCPDEYEWSPELGECICTGNCSPSPTGNPEPEIPQECTQPFSCQGKADGNYRDPWGCDTTYFCLNGQFATADFIPYCRPGTTYDADLETCVDNKSLKACTPKCPNPRPLPFTTTTTPATTTTTTPTTTTTTTTTTIAPCVQSISCLPPPGGCESCIHCFDSSGTETMSCCPSDVIHVPGEGCSEGDYACYVCPMVLNKVPYPSFP